MNLCGFSTCMFLNCKHDNKSEEGFSLQWNEASCYFHSKKSKNLHEREKKTNLRQKPPNFVVKLLFPQLCCGWAFLWNHIFIYIFCVLLQPKQSWEFFLAKCWKQKSVVKICKSFLINNLLDGEKVTEKRKSLKNSALSRVFLNEMLKSGRILRFTAKKHNLKILLLLKHFSSLENSTEQKHI